MTLCFAYNRRGQETGKEDVLRKLFSSQERFDFTPVATSKVLREHRAKYNRLNELLNLNREAFVLAQEDFAKYLSSSAGGRDSKYSTEEIIRALLVMFVEGDSYRDVVIRIHESSLLRDFVRLGPTRAMMDFSFLSKAFSALSPGIWQKINEAFSKYARETEKITGEKLRTDTTVYETNIHYPTDSSLLRDSFRTLARLLTMLQRENRGLGLNHRYHTKKVKKLAYFISRNAGSRSKSKQRKVKSVYRILIERVRWIVKVSREARRKLLGNWTLTDFARQLEHFETLAVKIINQAYKRVVEGIKLPADEKLYSIFEEHTELLKRGKAGKPIEFGHKVLVAQTKEKFIHHYLVMEKREEDKDLLEGVLNAHRKLFDSYPRTLATDKGFYESMKQLEKLERKIETVSICKKGRRDAEEERRESTDEFKEGQRFRAGVEGSISVLKRAFKLNRCLFKGFRNYAASVGCAVFCHNIVLLARA